MNQRFSACELLLAGLALAGCRDRAQSRLDAHAALASEVSTPADTVGCDLVRVMQHPEPGSLIAEFVHRDANGEFRQSSTWFDGAVDCPGHELAPDVATEATSYSITPLSTQADTVRALVQWTRLGYVSAEGAREALGRDVDTLTAVRTRFGWRLRSPALNPHMPPLVPRDTRGR